MADVFLSRPFAQPDILDHLCGGARAPAVVGQAVLDGYRPCGGDVPAFPILAAASGSRTEGVLLQGVDKELMARLAFFAAVQDQVAVEAPVATDDGTVPARVYVSRQSGNPRQRAGWNFAAWQNDWAGIAAAAASEIMGYFGRATPEEVLRKMPMVLSRAASRHAAARGKPAEIRSSRSRDTVQVIAEHTPHAGYFLTRDYQLRHALFDGAISDPVRREVFVATDAAIVLPYDAARDRVLLVEQFRMGPFGRGDPRPWMLEPVAGRVDPGEGPEDTAYRECLEEAGLELHRLELVSRHYCSPGCSTEYFHCYVGLCDLPELARGRGGLSSENEDIRTHVLPFDRAMELLASGEADNGPLVLCLIWLDRERRRLRASA